MAKSKKGAPAQRHNPLHVQIEEGSGVFRKSRKATQADNEHEDEDVLLDEKTSKKILKIARQQQQELRDEQMESNKQASSAWLDVDEEEVVGSYGDEDEEEEEEVYEYDQEFEVEPDEEALFNQFMGPGDADLNPDGTATLNLAEKIMEKIREKEQGMELPAGSRLTPSRDEEEEREGVMLPPKVIEVYSKVGELLSRYRSGKLPKAFKIIPTLNNWEDVLYVTNPDAWSPHAVYEATKLFISTLKARQSEKFIRQVLLERFRDDIRETKSLNYHLYRALKKSLYKPAAFFKGFLFPLCEDGNCTLREAIIAGSVLTKVSVPVLHSAAALLKIADMEYSGPSSLFIKILLDKKYALPYKVIDGVVFHFIRFRLSATALPTVWHQSFLVFAQRYKNDITDEQREALLQVTKLQAHPLITPEIRRELLTGAARDVVGMEIE